MLFLFSATIFVAGGNASYPVDNISIPSKSSIQPSLHKTPRQAVEIEGRDPKKESASSTSRQMLMLVSRGATQPYSGVLFQPQIIRRLRQA